ncbi:WbqC family protein [Rhodanobacter sp. C01]|uniref:WbqC family protein n=1 Tax=Rhodanobacter sp. C01 TaxID=1945856 RepID=UPI001438DCDB|nr:WbqC family protein [Rhodanobacter sp. C01]
MMKRVAVMQPYFFPYLGYWQLIAAVDCFVLFDEVQYINRGWINRNRILKPGGGWQYIQVPVARHPQTAAIRDVNIAPLPGWKARIVNQLAHYRAKAPHFDETTELVESALFGGQEQGIGELNRRIVRMLCEALSIRCEIVTSSDFEFDYSAVTESGDRLLAIALQLKAAELINPVNGISLLDPDKFSRCGVSIGALQPPAIAYPQARDRFEPSLSIIDVMMFNGIAGASKLLSERAIVTVAQSMESAGRSAHE